MIQNFIITDEKMKQFFTNFDWYKKNKPEYRISDDGKTVTIQNPAIEAHGVQDSGQIYRSIKHFDRKNKKIRANYIPLSERRNDKIQGRSKYDNHFYKSLKRKSDRKKYRDTHTEQYTTWSPFFIVNTNANIVPKDIIDYNNQKEYHVKIKVPDFEQLKKDDAAYSLYKEECDILKERIIQTELDNDMHKLNLCFNECSIELLNSLKDSVRDAWLADHPSTKDEFEKRYPGNEWPFKDKNIIQKNTLEHWFTFDILRCLPHSELYITYLDVLSLSNTKKHKYKCPCWSIDQTMDYMTQVTPTPYFLQYKMTVPYWDDEHKTFVGGWRNRALFEDYFKYMDAIKWVIQEYKTTPYDALDAYLKKNPDFTDIISIENNIRPDQVTRTMIHKAAIKDYLDLYDSMTADSYEKEVRDNPKGADGVVSPDEHKLEIAVNKNNRFGFYKAIYNLPNTISVDKLNGAFLIYKAPYRSHWLCLPEYLRNIIMKCHTYVCSQYEYLNIKTVHACLKECNVEYMNYTREIHFCNDAIPYPIFLCMRHKILIENSVNWRGVGKKFDEYLPVLTFKQHRKQKNITDVNQFNVRRRGRSQNNRYVIENLDDVISTIYKEKNEIQDIVEANDRKEKKNRILFATKRKRLLKSLWRSNSYHKSEIFCLYKSELLLKLEDCKNEIEDFIKKYECINDNDLFDVSSDDIFEFKLIDDTMIDKKIFKCIPKNVYSSDACFDYISKLCGQHDIVIVCDKCEYFSKLKIRGFLDFVKNTLYDNIVNTINIIENDDSRKWLSKIDKELLNCMGSYIEWLLFEEDGAIKIYKELKYNAIHFILSQKNGVFKAIKNVVNTFKKELRDVTLLTKLIKANYDQVWSWENTMFNEIFECVKNIFGNIDFKEDDGKRIFGRILMNFFGMKIDNSWQPEKRVYCIDNQPLKFNVIKPDEFTTFSWYVSDIIE